MRQPARRTRKHAKSGHKTLPAPTRGWVVNEPLALSQTGGARVLENWFPTTTGVRLRAGAYRIASLGAAIESLFVYETDTQSKLFAATYVGVYDVTSVADPDVRPPASLGARDNGHFSTVQIATAGGEYLYALNGADWPMLYDGTTWEEIDGGGAVTITGADPRTFSQAWLFASRIFFTQIDSLSAWCLPVDSIGGALTEVSLRAIFQRGGSLLFGASWSMDSGDGMDDRCVFVSTFGEVAVYAGTNPASSATWSLQGRYDIPAPLGKNAWQKVGGDLLILTKEGIIPISSVVSKDPAALSLAAVSRAIETEWAVEATARGGLPWEMLKWDEGNMGLVTLPREADGTSLPACLAVNLETGAWAKFTGWDARCFARRAGRAYFGNNDGRVLEVERGGYDDGEIYVCRMSLVPDHLGTAGGFKTVTLARSLFIANQAFRPQMSASVDYGVTFPSPPSAASITADGVWDDAAWDAAAWDGLSNRLITLRWQSIGQTGVVVGMQVQVTIGAEAAPSAELLAMDVIYERGAVVV